MPLFGLTATFSFVDKNSGAQIGREMSMEIQRLNVGKAKLLTVVFWLNLTLI
jgi:hypothetical protein